MAIILAGFNPERAEEKAELLAFVDAISLIGCEFDEGENSIIIKMILYHVMVMIDNREVF